MKTIDILKLVFGEKSVIEEDKCFEINSKKNSDVYQLYRIGKSGRFSLDLLEWFPDSDSGPGHYSDSVFLAPCTLKEAIEAIKDIEANHGKN